MVETHYLKKKKRNKEKRESSHNKRSLFFLLPSSITFTGKGTPLLHLKDNEFNKNYESPGHSGRKG